MSFSTKEKFEAAVKLIQGMPKSGSFQPSSLLQLRFYSLFKQATEGPCKSPKPSMFNVVARAKWDAWNKLGNMPAEEAMQQYIDELKKIVETMSFTEEVADFLDVLGPFYEVVYDNGSPVRLNKLEEAIGMDTRDVDGIEGDTGYSTEEKRTPTPEPAQVHQSEYEAVAKEEDDSRTQAIERVYRSSTSMSEDYRSIYSSTGSMYGSVHNDNGDDSDDEFVDPDTDFDQVGCTRRKCNCAENLKTVEQEIQETLQKLRLGIEDVKGRVATLEAAKMREDRRLRLLKSRNWMPFSEVSTATAVFLISWPFVTHFVLSWMLRRR